MANLHRGEIDCTLDGRSWRLCLTLGALAELESTCKADDILTLVARLTSGKLSARDAIAVIAAGLRAAGNDVTDVQVARMRTPDGIAGFVDIVARLLAASFNSTTEGSGVQIAAGKPSLPDPFPGAQ